MRRLAAAAVLAAALALPAPAAAQGTVQTVLFYLPTCGHCEYVMNELLFPVWFPQYGGEPRWHYDASLGADAPFFLVENGTLEVLLVNVATEAGRDLYSVAGAQLSIPLERMGVPRLVAGDQYFVGSVEIPEAFPDIVEQGIAAGGLAWPDLPGLPEILAALPVEETTSTSIAAGETTTTAAGETTTTAAGETTTVPATTSTVPSSSSTTTVVTTTAAPTTTAAATPTSQAPVALLGDSPWDRFRRDTTANSLALAVLALMVASLIGVAVLAGREGGGRPSLLIPLLALAGLGVAVYLTFVETSGSHAVCGPLGDCNTVQQSKWAEVFGIPVGVIGVAGYAVVLVSWAIARFGRGKAADWAGVALFAGALAGTGFSIYLTFLEPFVIGATCMWCLSSAVIVTALMWLSVRPGMAAWDRLRG